MLTPPNGESNFAFILTSLGIVLAVVFSTGYGRISGWGGVGGGGHKLESGRISLRVGGIDYWCETRNVSIIRDDIRR